MHFLSVNVRKTMKFKLQKEVPKINLCIMFKPHAQFQSMVRTYVHFQNNLNKTIGGVVHIRHTLFIHFHCKNAGKMFKLQKRSKFNLRIISKPHAYLQSIMKTSVKFQKIRNKTVRGVAHTRYPLSIHFHCQNTRKTTKFKLQKSIKN